VWLRSDPSTHSRVSRGPLGRVTNSAVRNVRTPSAVELFCDAGHNCDFVFSSFLAGGCECGISATTSNNFGMEWYYALRASQFSAGNVAPTSGTIGDGYEIGAALP